MTAQPDFTASHAGMAALGRVQWFGASRRLVGGEPDTRYGWLPGANGGPCIVKAMALDLASCAGTLLHHEREVLQRLQPPHWPVPECVAQPLPAAPAAACTAPAAALPGAAAAATGSDRLVTRFAGLSLAMLAQAGPQGMALLTPLETVAAWAAFLARALALDEAGALPLDLRPANLVLRLARGTRGQPLLTDPVLVDHAHTVVCGLDLRRPVWIDRHMAQVAPELRAALAQDQQALMDTFRRAGAALPGHEGADARARERSRRLWAGYDAPQAVQRLVDAGGLDRGAAMQYAAGVALQPLLQGLQRSAPAVAARLGGVVARLCAAAPQARYASLPEAAAALRAALPAVPTAAAGCVAAVDAAWLARAWTRGVAAVAAPAGPAARAADDTTSLAGEIGETDRKAAAERADPRPLDAGARSGPQAMGSAASAACGACEAYEVYEACEEYEAHEASAAPAACQAPWARRASTDKGATRPARIDRWWLWAAAAGAMAGVAAQGWAG